MYLHASVPHRPEMLFKLTKPPRRKQTIPGPQINPSPWSHRSLSTLTFHCQASVPPESGIMLHNRLLTKQLKDNHYKCHQTHSISSIQTAVSMSRANVILTTVCSTECFAAGKVLFYHLQYMAASERSTVISSLGSHRTMPHCCIRTKYAKLHTTA